MKVRYFIVLALAIMLCAFKVATVLVTIDTNPPGSSFSVDGVRYDTTQTFSWLSGSKHTISTTSRQVGGEGRQYVWSNWSDGGAISHSITTPLRNAKYTATFTIQVDPDLPGPPARPIP